MQLHKGRQQLTFAPKQEKVIDDWGPEKILQVYDPDTDMRGVLVIDNTSTGPGKGGIRFADTVTPRDFQAC
jgi:glutamate dehydrogenase/leucine dehydrogenase